MKITNEVYTACPECGTEVHGLDEIQKVFGYYIAGEEMRPYRLCRSCRHWAEKTKASGTGRNRHFRRRANILAEGKVLLRAKSSTIHFCCPECGQYLDDAPDFKPLQSEFRCTKCHYVGDHCDIEISYHK